MKFTTYIYLVFVVIISCKADDFNPLERNDVSAFKNGKEWVSEASIARFDDFEKTKFRYFAQTQNNIMNWPDYLSFVEIPFTTGKHFLNDASETSEGARISYKYLTDDGDGTRASYLLDDNNTNNYIQIESINGRWCYGNFELNLVKKNLNSEIGGEDSISFTTGQFYIKLKNKPRK